MQPTDHLLNTGLVQTGTPPNSAQRTIIVLGVGRGGTSLCSNALHHLGVFTGKDSRAPTYEDIPLSQALERHDFDAARSLINEYNALHDVWAFKRPTTNDTIRELHALVRKPVYVVIFRDILAIAQRNKLSMGVDPFTTLASSLEDYRKIVDFLANENPAALLASYEKVLRHKSDFIDALIEFSGIGAAVTSEQAQRARDSITPSPKDYLVNTSAVNFFGYLDEATTERLSGWAAYERSPEVVELEMFVNDRKVMRFAPEQFREDILRKGLHPTGRCGYSIRYPDGHAPRVGDQVAVRFAATGVDLRNSPKTIA